MAVYAQHAPLYIDAGLPVFPVDTRNKKPAVRSWQKATPRLSRGWASAERLAASDGIGIVMGKLSGITEIDVDAAGGAWITAARERFGDTPIIIRTASGKAKLWYRHNGEGRHIRPFHGLPIDVLGGGFTIGPPSYREDMGESYTFLTGGLDDLRRLPTIRADALDAGFTRAAEGVQRGARNDSLYRYCMVQARFCDDVEALIDVATTWASAFPEPLDAREIEQTARSAWRYESEGRNYLGLKKPQISEGDRIMDALIDHPGAGGFLRYLLRWHANRSSFAIAPRAMSEAGSPPWPRRLIEQLRDVLVQRGFLQEVRAPDKTRRVAGQYAFTGTARIWAQSLYTPSPSLGACLTESWQ